MSRRKLFLLILIAMLALMSVAAAAAQELAPTLISTEYIEGKGLVLKFEGAEDLDPVPSGGQVVIGDNVYEMTCNLNDDDILVCVAWLPKSHYGDYADVNLGDYVYEVLVVEPYPELEPKPKPPAPPPISCNT